MSKYPLGDWLTSVNFSKEDLRDREDGEVWMKKYPAYIVNRCLSGHIDAVLLVNELNRWHGLDNDLQYSFYLNSLRKKRRFSPWQKKEQVEDFDLIKKYFKYSDEKARDALRILTKDQIELIIKNEYRRKRMMDQAQDIAWDPEMMVEVTLHQPDDFLKVRETLTRIGVASRKEKKLFQSCHILHKKGKYYIVHFKELFALDGKHANLTSNDIQRRNRIAKLLSDWGLIGIVTDDKIEDVAPLNQIKVIAFKEKGDWILESKYNIGKKKVESA